MTDNLAQAPSTRLDHLSAEQRKAVLQQILAARGRAADGDAVPRRAGDGPAPLSFAQRRLWLAHQMEPESPTYNMLQVLRITGPLQVPALRRAFGELVRRHGILRTTFHAGADGEPVQVAHPPAPVPAVLVDLSALPADAREAQARRLARAEALRPFDLQRDPPLRVRLLRLGSAEHVLVMAVHHIAGDGPSERVMRGELAALYAAFAAGLPSPLAEPALHYADFAAWQRGRTGGPVLDRHTEWWRRRLAGAPPLLELPTDRPRATGAGERADKRVLVLSDALAGGLRALAGREGATLYMVLLAGWKALLARYASATDLVVGIPMGGRERVELEGVVGLVTSLLPLRTDLSGDPPFAGVVRRVREGILEAAQHQDLPLEELVEALGPESTPASQLAFGLQHQAKGGAGDGFTGLGVQSFGEGSANNPFELDLQWVDTGGRAAATLKYQRALYDGETVERMLEQYRVLLAAAAADPTCTLSRLPLLSPAEWARVVHAPNRTARPLPAASVYELFARQAARAPHAPAVEHGGETLTYAGLDARAAALAARLRARGVDAEAPVGVYLERGVPLVVAFLAVLRAGGAYLPLDTAAPAERIRELLDDAGARLVLTERGRAGTLPAGVEAVALDDPALAAAPQEDAVDRPDPAVHPDALACVLYTSGSTGRPKGVAIRHQGIVRLVRETDYAAFGPGDRVAQLSSAAFDAATLEVWGALLNGACLAVVDRDVSLDPAALAGELRRREISHLFLTTALFNRVAREAPGAFAGLRQLMFGGEAADPEAVARALEEGGPRLLLNLYGPAESTTLASWHPVERVDADAAVVPIGGPVANTTLYLLDGWMNPVPDGVPGELYVGGPGLARGYLGRPALTAERFVPHPYGGAGERLYRTGDRVRRNRRGELEFLGRYDFQVKIRGFRIEPGEVEAALLREPGVRGALVLLCEEGGEKRLVGYVAAPAAAGVTAAGLRAALGGRLPAYMVPSALVVLDAFPLTPGGKIDRRALPAPPDAGAEGYVAPRTPAEEVLAGIFADVLRRERVGAADDFFAEGGHSLLATRVAARVRAAFGVELPLRAVFAEPTVQGLARRIDAIRAEGAAAQAPRLAPAARDGEPLPLSFAQQRLWFVHRLRPGSAAYNMPAPLRVRGALHLPSLRRALSAVAARHEPLRTRFALRDGGPVQVIDPPAPVPLPLVDLSGLPDGARRAQLGRLAAEEAGRPFDLERCAPFRCTALRLAEDDTALLFTLHHIVSDGWSMDLLVREVSALYEAFATGGQVRLPELPVQYADYAAWQRGWLRGPVLDALAGWWRARLAGAPALLELPTDRPRPPLADDAGGRVPFALDADTAASLRRLARGEGATLFMTLLAAWQLLLSRYSGQDDVVVGTPIAGRTRVEVEGLIGFFVNTLALRGDLSGDPTFRELLGRVRESTLGAYQHQDLPFERLVEELGVERTPAHTPLFQVMLVLQNNASSRLRLGGLAVEGMGGGPGAVKFDLSLSLGETAEGIDGFLAYRRALWDPATMERMLEHFGRVLRAVAERPDLRVSQVPLLEGEERGRLLARSAGPAAEGTGGLLHAAFEARAARNPDAVALEMDGRTVTYGELDRGANRLARLLRRAGVGPEVRVAHFVDRSPEMVTGVLAILKAGGVYVPLDPSHPAERLGWQVRDCRAAVVLTRTELLDRLSPTDARAVLLDARAHAVAHEDDAPLPCPATPDNLAYLVYTSGSTGRPKGVMVPHRGAERYLAATARECGLDAGDVVLQRSTLSFDASVRDLLAPLSVGARVVIARADEAADPVRLLRRIREHRVTAVLAIVPSVLRPLLDAAEEAPGPSALRLLLVSGEPLAVADCRRVRRALGPVRVVNLWGATECSMSSTVHEVGDGDREGIAPVGAPIAGTRVYVLDGRMHPVPDGVAGEAYIAGAGVSRGYHGRPALTAERFLPDPCAPVPGARMYRVGDRVRRPAGGALEFLGRVDQQVKVRGIRVETGEVEAALRALPGVREAAVVVRQAGEGEARLVAYVAGEEGAAAADALRRGLERTLPAHLVPSVFVRLPAFPRLPNGKVDRGALPAPALDLRDGGPPYRAPSTDTERALAELWESLLEVRPVGVDDHFFRAGGHSMLAVRMMTQVRRRLGADVPLAALFEHPTVRALAARIDGDAREGWSPLVAIQPDGDRVPLFFVHPVGGEVLCYADLARALGSDQPFYGLQAGDLARVGEDEPGIEEMAARYLEAVRRVRPRGPYLLGGWSFGGFVAFEMAQQLARVGEEVPLVAMLDTRSPGERRPGDLDLSVRLAGMAQAEARRAGVDLPLTADDLRRLDPGDRIPHTLNVLLAAGVVPADADAEWLGAFLRGMDRRMASALRYVPARYPGRVALFVPAEPGAGLDADPVPGWDAYASEPLVTRTVPGDHSSMLRGDNAAVLAGHLRTLIDDSLR
jgi:amino acid adenylation domain-containing protein